MKKKGTRLFMGFVSRRYLFDQEWKYMLVVVFVAFGVEATSPTAYQMGNALNKNRRDRLHVHLLYRPVSAAWRYSTKH